MGLAGQNTNGDEEKGGIKHPETLDGGARRFNSRLLAPCQICFAMLAQSRHEARSYNVHAMSKYKSPDDFVIRSTLIN
jgi:hypothetical protein